MNSHPGMIYAYPLIRSTKLAMEKEMKSSDPDGMRTFMEDGYAVRTNGGVFDYSIDPWSRLDYVYRQSSKNRDYLQAYGDYVALDGTHLVDKYGHVMMMLTVVDALGLTQCAGAVRGPAEDSEHIIAALRAFDFPTGKDKVLHTDGGSWGPVVAEAFDCEHVLCTDHFLTKVLSFSCVLTGFAGTKCWCRPRCPDRGVSFGRR